MMKNNLMRVYALVLLLGATGLPGCRYSDVDKGGGETDIQSIRADVLGNFFSDSDAALKKYKQKWEADGYANSEAGTAEKLAAAGQLIRRDAAESDKYYKYVKSKLSDKNSGIQSLAVAALASVNGTESLQIIFDSISSPYDDVSVEAISALEYRYDSAQNDAELKTDLDQIAARAPVICSGDAKKDSSQLSRFCDRLGYRK